jgi:hypothetical protein
MGRFMAWLVVVLGGAVFGGACGTTSSTGSGFDAGPDLCHGQDSGAVVAQGGGYCCPIFASNCNGPPSGGWAQTAQECCNRSAKPDLGFTQATDSHGCPYLIEDPTYCCLHCATDAGSEN